MKRSRIPLHALRAFEAAAETGNLTRAAETLGVTHAAISYQIRLLEDHLGLALFERRMRPMQLTDAGQRLLEGTRGGFDRIAHCLDDLKEEEDYAGELSVVSVPGLGGNWLTSVLGEYVSQFPKVTVRMITSPWHRQTEFEPSDFSIVYGSAEQSGRRVTLLGQTSFFPVCSPSLPIAGNRYPDPRDMLNYTLIHEYNTDTWSRWYMACGVEPFAGTRRIYFDGAHLTLHAARAGTGIAMADLPTVAADLKEGRLVRLSDLTVPATHPYYITTPPLGRLKPAAKALEDLAVRRFRQIEAE
ncbi:LysR substrate-binding domain-containing protein [Methyloligella sp. 2.7D]|uniref:LysR substrate-binding domain-containing protein n=1 Tax=unclassified Methyloligella TaxID=2625955 RepID=UPI00157D9950|nr:LysR substrate-binding domain-containing protein [Methyloligella sp. GL2]QKP77923.1 LysR family transcriptional regulator [Methyloligella sp. GL2]